VPGRTLPLIAVLAAALADRDGAASLVPAETVPGLRITGAGERIEDEIARTFDLDRGPLIRFALFGGDLVVTAHHAVFDGHSKDVLVRDLAALREGTKLGLLPPTGYAQHAEAERWRVERALPEARAFWQPRWRPHRTTFKTRCGCTSARVWALVISSWDRR